MQIIKYSELTLEKAKKGCMVLDMPNDAYHAYDGLSKSGLDQIDESPADFMYSEPRERTRFMVIGEAIHKAVLETELFEQNYVLLKDVKDRRASEYKQAIKHHDQDLVLISTEVDNVKGMQAAIHADNNVMRWLSLDGYCEISVFATCKKTGELIKCRFDKLVMKDGDFIGLDLKKTQSIKYDKLQRTIANYRYHVQDAWYKYVFNCATGETLSQFKFIFVKEKMPHSCKVITLDDEAFKVGTRLAMAGLDTYHECNIKSEWPHPDSQDEAMCLPAWALDDEAYEEAEVI